MHLCLLKKIQHGPFEWLLCVHDLPKTNNNKKKPIILNIPNRLVALRVSPIFTMREWGTECYRPRRTLEGSMDVRRRTFVSAGLVGMRTIAPPVFDSDPGNYHCEPCLIQLWKLSFEDDCLTLHYPENLNSFAL